MKKKTVIFASDFKGVEFRKKLLEYANQLEDLSLEDIGILEGSPLDFVDIAKQLALKLEHSDAFGVLICSDGHGVAMAANKFNFIRAALCSSEKDAQAARKKLNANVLCLGSKHLSLEAAQRCLEAFVKTPFEADKYGSSVEKLAACATLHADKGINLIVRGVIICDHHILLSRPTHHNKEFEKDLYFLPGGHVDYNESAISALEREILEEMHLRIEGLEFIGALECSWNKKKKIYHELNLVYRVNISNLSLSAPPQSSEPFLEFVWCPLSNISHYSILPDKLKPMLQEATEKRKTTSFYSQMIR